MTKQAGAVGAIGRSPAPDPGECLIEARGVVRSFGETPALRGAGVSVTAGEILAVMGPSGSGKSTLLHCLAGILTPDSGEIWFDGRRIDAMGEAERSALRREHFGFVFQFGQLVPELTAEENVALPLLLAGARRAAALERARPWFETLDLQGMEQRRSGELSGGQAQRVALARGLVTGPRLLFADEPTGSLDSLAGELVMNLLTAAARDQGTTVVLVTSISATSPSGCNGSDCALGVGINSSGIDLVLSVITAALLFPVLIFIGTATRLSAARREQRFAAIRLVGATPRQVSVISAVESSVAAVAGVALGFGLFFLLRTPLAAVPFTGVPFFPSDLSLSLVDILAVAIGVPVAAAAAALLALRRVQISPLGVTRRVTPRAPRAWRLIPLLAGLAELAYFVAAGHPKTTGGQIQAFLPGFLLIMAGLVIAGPWLTMAGARIMAQRARRPDTLIAARRLADDPRAGFRAVSGLVLALFVTAVAVGVITTIVAHRGAPSGGAAASDTLTAQLGYGPGDAVSIQGRSASAPVPDPLLRQLRSIQGVQAVSLIHTNPLGITIPAAKLGLPSSLAPVPAGLISCAQLSRLPLLGRCQAGAQAAAIPSAGILNWLHSQTSTTWPAAAISAQRLQRLPVQAIFVGTNGSTSAIERARTALELAYPYLVFPPSTIGDLSAEGARETIEFEQLAEVVILVSLPIAGCTLAVSVAAGLTDRKRPFSLLRLTGAPLGVLRHVVALESAVPLLITAVISTGLGFVAAGLFLSAQMGYSLRPPGAEYYVIVLAGLAASLGIIAATLPVLNRTTGPETARNE
jgi:ABC-type lipoprotein export system ATPase subunit